MLKTSRYRYIREGADHDCLLASRRRIMSRREDRNIDVIASLLVIDPIGTFDHVYVTWSKVLALGLGVSEEQSKVRSKTPHIGRRPDHRLLGSKRRTCEMKIQTISIGDDRPLLKMTTVSDGGILSGQSDSTERVNVPCHRAEAVTSKIVSPHHECVTTSVAGFF